MSGKFIYVTYIRTTPKKLWDSLTKPEFNRKYWFGAHQECDWKRGSPWRLMYDDGRVVDAGEVLEIEKPRRIVLKWRHQMRPELKAEGNSTATFLLEPMGAMVKLTVTHEIRRNKSRFIEAVSGGWPAILASLKSLLETGKPLKRPTKL